MVDEEIEVNRIRESSTTRKVSDASKNDEGEAGTVVRFRYVTPGHHEETKHSERGREHKHEEDVSRDSSHASKDEVIREEELGSFRYVPAPDNPEGPVLDDDLTTLIESAHGSQQEGSSRAGTVHSVESEHKVNDVYHEDEDGGDQYLGSFRHVPSTGGIPPLPAPTDSEPSRSDLEASNKERLRRLSEQDEDAFRSFRYVSRGSPHQRQSISKLDSPSSQRHIRRASVSNLSVDVPSQSSRRHNPIPNTIKYAAALHNREVERLKAQQRAQAQSSIRRYKEDDQPASHRNGESNAIGSTGRVSSLKQRFEDPSTPERSQHPKAHTQRSEDSREETQPRSSSQRGHAKQAAGTRGDVRPRKSDDESTTEMSPSPKVVIRYRSGALHTPQEEILERAREPRRGKSRKEESPPPRRPSRVRFVSPVVSSSPSNNDPPVRILYRAPPSDRTTSDALGQYREENAQMRRWEENWSEDRRRELLGLNRERRGPRRERRYRAQVDESRAHNRQSEQRRSHHRRHSPSRGFDYINRSSSSREDYSNYSNWHNQPNTPPAASPSTSTIERLASPPPEGYEGLMNQNANVPVNPDPGATTPFSERSLAYGMSERHYWRMMFKTDVEQSPSMKTSDGIPTSAGLSASGCDGAGARTGRPSSGTLNSRKLKVQDCQSQNQNQKEMTSSGMRKTETEKETGTPTPLSRFMAKQTSEKSTPSPLAKFLAGESKESTPSPNTVRKKKVKAQKEERKKNGSGYVSPYVSEVSEVGEEIEED